MHITQLDFLSRYLRAECAHAFLNYLLNSIIKWFKKNADAQPKNVSTTDGSKF